MGRPNTANRSSPPIDKHSLQESHHEVNIDITPLGRAPPNRTGAASSILSTKASILQGKILELEANSITHIKPKSDLNQQDISERICSENSTDNPHIQHTLSTGCYSGGGHEPFIGRKNGPNTALSSLGNGFVQGWKEKGYISSGVKPVLEVPTSINGHRLRSGHANDRARATRLCPPPPVTSRSPSRRAFLTTCDRSSSSRELLDHTARDSERLEECFKKNLGFKPEDIRIAKATGEQLLEKEAVLQGLKWLLAEAVDGDVLVWFVSMHAGLDESGNVCLEFLDKDGSTVVMDGESLVRIMNCFLHKKTRCTLEVIFDICHAGGLIKCQYLIRRMGDTILTTGVTAALNINTQPHVSSGSTSQTETAYHDVQYPSYRHNLASFRVGSNAIPHKSQPVAMGLPSPSPSNGSGMPSEVRKAHAHGSCSVVQGKPMMYPIVGLKTEIDVFVWAACGVLQLAHESSKATNGVLTDAICSAIEKFGYLARWTLFDQFIAPNIEEENAIRVKLTERKPTDDPDKANPQVQLAQLWSNRSNADQILNGCIFHELPKA